MHCKKEHLIVLYHAFSFNVRLSVKTANWVHLQYIAVIGGTKVVNFLFILKRHNCFTTECTAKKKHLIILYHAFSFNVKLSVQTTNWVHLLYTYCFYWWNKNWKQSLYSQINKGAPNTSLIIALSIQDILWIVLHEGILTWREKSCKGYRR